MRAMLGDIKAFYCDFVCVLQYVMNISAQLDFIGVFYDDEILCNTARNSQIGAN